MITYKTGNLLDTPDHVIVHGVNCQGVMGSGVAKAIREKWPVVYEEYRNAWNEAFIYLDNNQNSSFGDFLLGRIQFVGVGDGKHVVNAFTQEYYSHDGKKYVSYDAIDQCMSNLRIKLELDYWAIPTVSMPKIGAGLGGGNWEVIEAIINHRLHDVAVTIWEL